MKDNGKWAEYVNDPLRHSNERIAVSHLQRYLSERLPEYMVPTGFVIMNSLPLTPEGKVDRNALPAPEMRRPETAQSYVAPRMPLEEALTETWQKVLGIERVGVNDNFFALGGNSLKAVQVMAQLRRDYGLKVASISVFEKMTVSGLAEMLVAGGRGEHWAASSASTQRRGQQRRVKKGERMRRLRKESEAQFDHE